MEAQEQAAPVAPVIRTEPWRSEQIGELCAALAKCQAEIKNPKKGKTAKVASKKGESSSYSYVYADISDVCETINAVAPKFGLSHSQIIRPNAEGRTCIFTMIMHESGQWLLSEYKLPPAADNHEMGGNITYGRRYALAPMFGIAAEEDTDFNGSHRKSDEADDEAKEQAKKDAADLAEKYRSGRFHKIKPGEDVLKTRRDVATTAAAPSAPCVVETSTPPPADDTPAPKTALQAKLAEAKAKAEKAAREVAAEEKAERDAIQNETAELPNSTRKPLDYTGIHAGLAKKLKEYDDGKNDPIEAFESYVKKIGVFGPDGVQGGVRGLPDDFCEQALAQWKKVEPKFTAELLPF